MNAMPMGVGVLVAVCLLAALVVSQLFRKVEQGKALIVSKLWRVDVTFTGQVVLPVLRTAEVTAAAEGLAAVRVRDKEAEVIAKAGRAEAEATQARMRARPRRCEAEGSRAKSLARAESTRAQALAEAEGVGEKLKAEAAGLTEKAAAMAALDDAPRGHEEYRLRLAAEKDIRLAGLEVQRQIAEAQSTVLATGLENADIDVVGGDSVFFDRLVGAVALAKGVDGFVQHSETTQALARPWLDGSSKLTDDMSRILGPVSTAGVQNLTDSALLMKLMKNDGSNAGHLQQLLDGPGELGVAETSLAALNGHAKG